MRKPLVLLAFLMFFAGDSVLAQGLAIRQLPAKGQRGQLGDPQPLPIVLVGGKVLRLAPGAVIYDQQNRSIVHGNLPPMADVFYTTDAAGNIQRLYVLTPDESVALNARSQ